MASQKGKASTASDADEIDLANLAKEVQHLELLARRSEAKFRRLDADMRFRELSAKNRAEMAAKNQEPHSPDETSS